MSRLLTSIAAIFSKKQKPSTEHEDYCSMPQQTRKSLSELINSMKGMSFPIGTVHTWSDGEQRRKVDEGIWVPAKLKQSAIPDTPENRKKYGIPADARSAFFYPANDPNLVAKYVDSAGRTQYRYKAKVVEQRKQKKFGVMLKFVAKLPDIRKQILKDIESPALTKENACALAIVLMDKLYMRIGTEKYAEENETYGVATLLNSHISINGDKVSIEYRGKKGVLQKKVLRDAKLAQLLNKYKAQGATDDPLLKFGGNDLTAKHVNDYLHQFGDFSSKNFRTFHASRMFAEFVSEMPKPKSKGDMKHNIAAAIRKTAEALGHTPSVCRSSYIDPDLIHAYIEGKGMNDISYLQKALWEIENDKEKRFIRYLKWLANGGNNGSDNIQKSVIEYLTKAAMLSAQPKMPAMPKVPGMPKMPSIGKVPSPAGQQRGLPIGTTRIWGGVEYKKVAPDDWRPVPKPRQPAAAAPEAQVAGAPKPEAMPAAAVQKPPEQPTTREIDILGRGTASLNPKIYDAQVKWNNYGQYEEIEARKIFEKNKYGNYIDDFGDEIIDEIGARLQDGYDDENDEKIEAMATNEQMRDNFLKIFTEKEGKEYLDKVIEAIPKNPDGTITAYRIGEIVEGKPQSYTLSIGLARTFSQQGTDIPIKTFGLPKHEEFGDKPVHKVKIDPKGIKAYSFSDKEILVNSKYVIEEGTKSETTAKPEGKVKPTPEAQAKIKEIDDWIENIGSNDAEMPQRSLYGEIGAHLVGSPWSLSRAAAIAFETDFGMDDDANWSEAYRKGVEESASAVKELYENTQTRLKLENPDIDNITLFRGAQIEEYMGKELNVGDAISIRQTSCFTDDENIGRNFAKRNAGTNLKVVFEIKCPHKNIISYYKENNLYGQHGKKGETFEGEYTLVNIKSLKISKVEKRGDITHLICEIGELAKAVKEGNVWDVESHYPQRTMKDNPGLMLKPNKKTPGVKRWQKANEEQSQEQEETAQEQPFDDRKQTTETTAEHEKYLKKFGDSISEVGKKPIVDDKIQMEGDKLLLAGETSGYNISRYEAGDDFGDIFDNPDRLLLTYSMYASHTEHGAKLLLELAKRGLQIDYEVIEKASSVLWDETWGDDADVKIEQQGGKSIGRSREYVILFNPKDKSKADKLCEILGTLGDKGKNAETALSDAWFVPDMRSTQAVDAFKKNVMNKKDIDGHALIVMTQGTKLDGFKHQSVYANESLSQYFTKSIPFHIRISTRWL